MIKTILQCIILFIITSQSFGQSIAREWNEALLNGIRNDLARPTVHARNLFHSSVLMYDGWAVFNDTSETYFLGNTVGGYTVPFDGITAPTDIQSAIDETISYAVYRLILHRFATSPNYASIAAYCDQLMDDHGYNRSFTSTDYSTGSYAALGNYMASQMINFGLQDGSNEQNDYENQEYTSVNSPLLLTMYEETNPIDPNRWQPLAFDTFIDQSGNVFPTNTPAFLSPEWGEVTPFSLKNSDLSILDNGFDAYVYNDPGAPINIQNSPLGLDDPYKWHFSLVVSWSSHLDPNDPTTIDISPASLGNLPINEYPSTFEEYKTFYDFTNGGATNYGHAVNPYTNQAYTPQIVKRADYARVLAEFWADGPDSETPPGHWFTIFNYVSDNSLLEKKIGGQGAVVGDLEWDVKGYFTLGGAMHDAAINTWGIKGYYDYIRPISAIRYMAGKGQSSDTSLANYDPHGLPIVPGLIEVISTGDPLAGTSDENVGKLKIYSWKGPDYISNPSTDIAGVGWIEANKWWPYQRGSFVTPNFAGYLSGHSTFSSAAAEVMTDFTGDAFFPGGMGTFDITANDFLVFETGPSQNISLQWATYRDASDQTSLSRIWGGIHPPIDDIKGRIIGEKIGNEAFTLASSYFDSSVLALNEINIIDINVYPNPFSNSINIQPLLFETYNYSLWTMDGKNIPFQYTESSNGIINIKTSGLTSGVYVLKITNQENNTTTSRVLIKN